MWTPKWNPIQTLGGPMRWGLAALVVAGVLLAAESARAALRLAPEPTSQPAEGDAPAPGPSTAPATGRAPKPKKSDAIRMAIAELTREASKAMSKKEAFPRVESDYFKDKTVDVDTTELLKTLSRTIVPDPRVDAYIKLQLLSAKEKFEGDDAAGAIDAYIKGIPQLMPVPNSQRDRQPWDMKKMQAKQKDIERINSEFLAWRAPFEDRNYVVLRYRDMLRDRIDPPDALKPRWFKAQLEDLSQRYEAGFEPAKELTTFSKDVMAWSQLAPKKDLTDLIGFLTEYTKRAGGSNFYEKLVWSDRSKSAYWRDRPAQLEKRKLEKLIEELKTAEQNAL
jgi:hypothetical protein